ncbi:MAG TPA: LamG domain-containing protein [Candidatus Acidoferrales bacterium]|nr:LamG domain-containing protein [Candidatus Acidoferrales bacterium]
MSMTSSSPAQSTVTNGLVAYYPFNGDATDASGFNNNGTVTGATLTADRFGNPNSAYHFTGNGSTFITIPDSPSLEIASSITMTAWVQTGGGGSFSPRIISKYNFELGLDSTAANPKVFGDFQPGQVVYSPNVSLNGGRWMFLACTYDGQTLQVYTNGLPAGQLTAPGSLTTSSRPVAIGENLDGGSDFFNGSIDDVRIYNRALSTNEMAQLFADESPHPNLTIIKAVALASDGLQAGSSYQVQASTDLLNWTNQGQVFTVTSSSWQSTNYWPVANWDKLFFRLIQQ